MKMIYVYGDDDFSALEFEKYFDGKPIREIIEQYFDNEEEHDGDFEMKLYEFGDIDPKFVQFLRKNILDYDQLKHENFYFEDEIVKF